MSHRVGTSPPLRGPKRAVARGNEIWWSLLSAPPLRGLRAGGLIVGAAAAVAGIGFLSSSVAENLAILYVIPPLVVTVYMSRNVGLAFSALSATAWVMAAGHSAGQPALVIAADAALRFLVVALVVILVSGLRSAVIRIRQSECRSRDFIGLAAHQIRTPLTGLRASAEALLGLGASAAQERLLLNIALESERAARLVSRLLAISQLDLETALPQAPTDLNEVCREAVRRLDEAAQASRVSLSLVSGTRAAVAMANPDGCLHIVSNLLENAVRHAKTWVTVGVSVEQGFVEVRVSDDGAGLPPGSEELAFECFVSLDGAGGSGLGLPLSRGLARGFGGDLRWEGAGFFLVLPAAEGAGADRGAQPVGPKRSVRMAEDGIPSATSSEVA